MLSMPACSRPAWASRKTPPPARRRRPLPVCSRRSLPDGTHTLAIEQGYEMGRPSLIRLAVEVAAGRLVSAAIGGEAVIVTEGTIEA